MLEEPARQTPVIGEADVVVLGGGPAGIAAALAAARAGCSTILVERYGFLGGAGTASMVSNFCGLFAVRGGTVVRVARGIADDVLDALAAREALGEETISRHFPVATQAYDIAAFKCVLDDLLIAAGVRLLFHTVAVGAIVTARRVVALVIESKSGRAALRGATFVDASGDADLAAWCGVPFELGDEQGSLQFPTMMLRVGQVDHERAQRDGLPRLHHLMETAEATGRYRFPRRNAIVRPQPHSSEYRVNVTQVSRNGAPLNGLDVDDLSYGEVEGRRQASEFVRFLREFVPGFEASYLLELAPQLGIRETRRIAGAYRVTGEDVLAARTFDDAIGVNPWPIEEHVLGDIRMTYIGGRGYHQIPYRALVTNVVDNLFVAGRCASADHDAQASLRVTGPCFVMGQAAGVAASLALNRRCPVSEIPIPTLQSRLVDAGVFLGEVPAA
jgi:hypothetical protein